MPIATLITPPDREEPAKTTIFPEPRSFFWLPLDGHHHPTEIRNREVAGGELIGVMPTFDRQYA